MKFKLIPFEICAGKVKALKAGVVRAMIFCISNASALKKRLSCLNFFTPKTNFDRSTLQCISDANTLVSTISAQVWNTITRRKRLTGRARAPFPEHRDESKPLSLCMFVCVPASRVCVHIGYHFRINIFYRRRHYSPWKYEKKKWRLVDRSSRGGSSFRKGSIYRACRYAGNCGRRAQSIQLWPATV